MFKRLFEKLKIKKANKNNKSAKTVNDKNSDVKIIKKKMTVVEAFLLNCRFRAKNLNNNGESFTLSELVHKVASNEEDAKEWIRKYGDKIYNALKEDVQNGNLKAKVVLVKKGDEIVYEMIKFLKIK